MATPAGRLLSETKDDAATVYTYYKTGELKTATDAENNTTTYSYDNMGNVTTVRNALGNSTLYEYDNNGNLSTGRGTVLCPARCLSGFREVSYFFEQVLVLNGCLQWTKLVLHKTISDIKIHTRYAGILPAYLSKIIIPSHERRTNNAKQKNNTFTAYHYSSYDKHKPCLCGTL